MKLTRQAFTLEFKELAVKRVNGGQSIGMVCKVLGLGDQTLRNWVKAAAAGRLVGAWGRAVTLEEMELSRLRAETLRLKRELEIIKKAAAYFAKDALGSTPGLMRKVNCFRCSKCAMCLMSASAAIGRGNAAARRIANV